MNMNVDPVYAAVGKIFEYQPMFRVPKYQRSYAWDKSEIEDFLNDIENAFTKRKQNAEINHFFGGIVSVVNRVPGTVNQNEYELVDGQQRMATFVIFIASIITLYKALVNEADISGDQENKRIIEGRMNTLSLRFIEFEQEINRRTQTVDVITLSKADEIFFRDLIRDRPSEPSRDSHDKLLYARTEIKNKIQYLTGSGSLNDRVDNLEVFNQLIDGDFSIIHIKTDNKQEAYTLFRVLNDRGKSLTDGDLLRARTLELLEGFTNHQSSVELLWDEILSDSPSITEKYLKWIYASFQGRRPGNNNMYDDFLRAFYPQHNQNTQTIVEADQILRATQSVLKEIQNCRKLVSGTWPYVQDRQIPHWDVNRLALLLRELGLEVTVPLLLASCKLDQRKFSEIVQMLERFLFRFKTIGNQHITPVMNLVNTESVIIRADYQNYSITNLANKLRVIQNDKVNDGLFKSLIDNLNYRDGGANQPIKYFLMTLEHYSRWYAQGTSGSPVCLDKSRIYDFSYTTIEHIYPKNAGGAVIDEQLQPFRNSIGNLTFMGPDDNHTGADNDFDAKKPIFQHSSVTLNKEIGEYVTWNVTALQDRENRLKEMACKIFSV